MFPGIKVTGLSLCITDEHESRNKSHQFIVQIVRAELTQNNSARNCPV
jgi:hypothetical protein